VFRVLKLRIVGVSSSARHGNTEILIQESLRAAREAPVHVETELVTFAGKRIEPCTDCQVCAEKRQPCIKKDDWASLVRPLVDPVPDGIIIGSPVYFFSVNSQLRAFFERCTSLLKGLWFEDFPYPPPDFSRTAAAAIAVGYHRHGGVEHAISSILHWFLTMGCACTGADYIGGGAWQQEVNAKNAVLDDAIGTRNARIVGRRVAYLAYLLSSGAQADPRTLEQMREYRSTETA
jgi:multimeric flavodoxin WrbA